MEGQIPTGDVIVKRLKTTDLGIHLTYPNTSQSVYLDMHSSVFLSIQTFPLSISSHIPSVYLSSQTLIRLSITSDISPNLSIHSFPLSIYRLIYPPPLSIYLFKTTLQQKCPPVSHGSNSLSCKRCIPRYPQHGRQSWRLLARRILAKEKGNGKQTK